MLKRGTHLTRILCVGLGLMLLLSVPGLSQAEWINITDELTVSMGRPKSSKKNLVWISQFYVTNASAEPIQGPLRVVITSSTAPLSTTYGAPNGTTADGKPYYNIVTDPAYTLNPGAKSPTVEICFELTRKRPAYTVRVELDQQAPPSGPVLSVEPTSLDFGSVLVGASESLYFAVGNTGDADLTVSAIEIAGAGFQLFPPLTFTVPAGGPSQAVSVGFSPTAEGTFTGAVTVFSDGGIEDLQLSGMGEASVYPGDIAAVTALELGTVVEGATVEKDLSLGNQGEGLLSVQGATTDEPAFTVGPAPGSSLPFTLSPGEQRTLRVALNAPVGTGGTTLSGQLGIESDDPDENPFLILLQGDVISASVAALADLPVVSARVRNPEDLVTAESCAAVGGEAVFTASVADGDRFDIILTDGGGNAVTSMASAVPAEGGTASFGPIDVCGLADGVLSLAVGYHRDDRLLGTYPGTPAVKHTGSLPAPVLEPVGPVTFLDVIQVCGTSRQQTSIHIAGGASTVATTLGLGETAFCLDVPLRPNEESTLIATAVDDLAPEPKPTAAAAPVRVVQLDPSEIVIAEATSRPLTAAEVATPCRDRRLGPRRPGELQRLDVHHRADHRRRA